MRLKLLPLAVALAILGMTALTIGVGALAREETVVERPYEEGLRYDEARRARLAGHGHAHAPAAAEASACDLGAGPCSVTLDDLALTAELGPRPLVAMRSLTVNAELRRSGAPVDAAEIAVSFAMPGMTMGENAVRLAPAGGGRYGGAAVLVRCPSGRREWVATFTIRERGATRRAELPLRLGE
ncbi:MAG TPA: FixH family protein [Anaeromyxobacter sp.]|nr:FixH family protein [Anaeromyxobacter sp.]